MSPLPANPGQRPVGDEGFVDHLRSLAAAVADYLRARLQLAGLESKEASVHYLIILIWLGVGLFGLVFGYIFLCVAAVFLIATVFGVAWTWVLLGFGIGHLILAAIAAWIVKVKFSRSMFSATISEFKKDQSWLNQKTN